jgi:hypothetical protein
LREQLPYSVPDAFAAPGCSDVRQAKCLAWNLCAAGRGHLGLSKSENQNDLSFRSLFHAGFIAVREMGAIRSPERGGAHECVRPTPANGWQSNPFDDPCGAA